MRNPTETVVDLDLNLANLKTYGRRDLARMMRMVRVIRYADLGKPAIGASHVHALIVENRKLKRQVKELKQ